VGDLENTGSACIPGRKISHTLKIPIWLLMRLNERPQISKVLDAEWIGLCADRIGHDEKNHQAPYHQQILLSIKYHYISLVQTITEAPKSKRHGKSLSFS
jgi:hypothetical protein